MAKTETAKHFSQLDGTYEVDIRETPDTSRQGAFRRGWKDVTLREAKYSDETLRKLTWQNLGYRFARIVGDESDDYIRTTYEELARMYERTH